MPRGRAMANTYPDIGQAGHARGQPVGKLHKYPRWIVNRTLTSPRREPYPKLTFQPGYPGGFSQQDQATARHQTLTRRRYFQALP